MAHGHESWIDPVDFTLDVGQPITADIRVGEAFKGSSYSYLPANFRLFEIAQGDTRVPVEGRLGDRPALQQAPLAEGLNVVLHVTRNYDLTYKTLEKFASFVRHKDAEWVLAAHAEAGYPNADFGEVYSRYTKSLIAVGNGAGADQNYGLLTEIVALANPYTDDMSAGLPVQVFYDGAVHGFTQIELFAKSPDDTVEITVHKTDEQGIAILPVVPGVTYMVDAVVLRLAIDPVAKENGAIWESLWANLTFAVPQ